MRVIILYIWFVIMPTMAYGQLYMMSDHYVHNALAINPAFSGSQDALNANISHRNYWSGFEGSPKTISLSIHAPVNNERVGLGFLLISDKIGVIKETSLVGNYAYRIDFGYGKLAFGLGFGISFSNANWSELAAHDPDDALLTNNSSTGIMPDFSLGIYYTTKKYFVGLSIPLFLSHDYDVLKDKYLVRNDFTEYNYFCNAGYIFDIDADIKLFPSLLVKYHKGNTTQIDINSQIILKNKVWLGGAYRSESILVGMLQYQVNDQLRVAYSYDFNLGEKGSHYNDSNEIMLNYVFKYKVGVAGPRQF